MSYSGLPILCIKVYSGGRGGRGPGRAPEERDRAAGERDEPASQRARRSSPRGQRKGEALSKECKTFRAGA